MSDFKIEIGQVFKGNKRDLIIIDREYRDRIKKDGVIEKQKYYKYKCNKCGYDEGWAEESYLIHYKKECSCCTNRTVVEGINDIPTTDPWMIKYFQGGYDEAKLYTKGSGKKIKFVCPECGRVRDKEIKVSNIYYSKSIGCSCGDGYSYGHKFVFNLLTQLQLKFIDNHKFDWCKFYNTYKEKEVTGEYDFVLKNNKLIIEVDGDFHRCDNSISGQTKEESEFIDSEKDRLAKKNGYEIIRISDEYSIKNNIINSELSKIFDLSNIDWLKCEEFALSNRCKEACEIKRKNPDTTTVEIGKIMNMHCGTIRRYLKKGNELGWCEYDPKEERRKNILSIRKKISRSYGKLIKIFKDGVYLGTFPSCSELERQSEELFGIKLFKGYISETCIGKYKQYKGFTFKYV